MLSSHDRSELLARVTDPKSSGFYRRFYGLGATQTILADSADAWIALPLLDKSALLKERLAQRSYIPLAQLDHLRATSGTSGLGPLFCPRTKLRHMEYRLAYHDFKKPVLAYPVPAMPHWHEAFQAEHGVNAPCVVLDPANPAATARLARDAGVDAISCFAFHIAVIAPHLVAEGVAPQIRFIELCGEVCSRALFSYIKTTFPNAVVIPFYGSSEVEDSPIGVPCRAITGEEPLAVYHGKPSHYLEIIDPETLATIDPQRGAEGELVLTAYPGEPSAFPLLRFRTGDSVRVVEDNCAKHGTWSFTVLGRTQMDFVKVQGGVLSADEIARALATMPERISDRFELHCFEEPGAAGPLLAPVLKIELNAPDGADFAALAEEIAARIRVAPEMTYAEGVSRGRYAPLRCEALTPVLGKKTKRIIRHAQ